jgi:hypothetical protein
MVEAVGWDMYDPRLTIKGRAAEALGLGDCAYLHTDGLIYYTDATEDVHGCALKAVEIDDEVTLVTHGRLRMVTAQTPGNPVMGPNGGSGTPPDDGGGGRLCGMAIETYLILVHVGDTAFA